MNEEEEAQQKPSRTRVGLGDGVQRGSSPLQASGGPWGHRSKGLSARACPTPVLISLENFEVFLLPQLFLHIKAIPPLCELLTGLPSSPHQPAPFSAARGCPFSSGLLAAHPLLGAPAAVGLSFLASRFGLNFWPYLALQLLQWLDGEGGEEV